MFWIFHANKHTWALNEWITRGERICKKTRKKARRWQKITLNLIGIILTLMLRTWRTPSSYIRRIWIYKKETSISYHQGWKGSWKSRSNSSWLWRNQISFTIINRRIRKITKKTSLSHYKSRKSCRESRSYT